MLRTQLLPEGVLATPGPVHSWLRSYSSYHLQTLGRMFVISWSIAVGNLGIPSTLRWPGLFRAYPKTCRRSLPS